MRLRLLPPRAEFTARPTWLLTELVAKPVETTQLSRSAAQDLDRSFRLEHPKTVPFSPLDAVLGWDGSATRALHLVFHGAGDIAEAAFDGARRASGRAIVATVEQTLTARNADLHDLEQAVTVLIGAGDCFSVPRHARAVADALDALARLASPVRLVADVDDETLGVIQAAESDEVIALAAAEATMIGYRGRIVRLCGHCRRPFVSRRANETYCRRPAPGTEIFTSTPKSCMTVGPQRRHADSMGGVDAAYRSAYKRLYNRVHRGTLDRGALEEWRERARTLVEAAKAGQWTNSQFEHQLRIIEPESED